MEMQVALRPDVRPVELPEGRPAILFVISHSSAGGAQEVIVNLAHGFHERGYRAVLVALYPMRENVRATPPHLPWHYISPRQPTLAASLWQIVYPLAQLMRRVQPLASFSALPAANVATAVAAAVAGTGTRVITGHHGMADHYTRWVDALDTIAGCLPLVSSAVTVSAAVAHSLAGKPAAYRRKIRIVPNALPPDIELAATRLVRSRPAEARKRRLVVATGRLAMQKNYPVLLRAARLLPDVSFVIVGDGPLGDELRRLARELGVADRVEFMGFRPRSEVLKILAGASVFAQPSVFEGHSLALVEAARMGLPLIVSSVPGQLEGIDLDGEPCGVAVGLNDDVALAAAIRNMLDDEHTYRTYADKAARLSLKSTFKATLDAYEELTL